MTSGPVPVHRLLAALLAALVLSGPAAAHPGVAVLEAAVEQEVAQHPDDPETQLRAGQVHQIAGEFDAALVALARAAEHGADPDAVAAARGEVFLQAGWPRMARLEFDRVLARHPDRFGVLFERGRAEVALGRFDEAADDYGRAVAGMAQPTPDHVIAHRDALLAVGRPEDAVRALDAGMARLGRVPSLELAAVDLEERLGRHDDALRRMDRLIAQSPRNEAWVARRGDILERAGRSEEARAAFAAALRLIEARPGPRRGQPIVELEHRLRATLATANPEEKP